MSTLFQIQEPNDDSSRALSRRDFIRRLGALVASAALAGVGVQPAFAQGGAGGLANWNEATFAAQLGKPFTVNLGKSNVTLNLNQVMNGNSKVYHSPKKMTTAPAGQSFLLVFRGPASAALANKTYAFHHAQLGAFSLFVTPTKVDATGRSYTAVVNHIHA